ncbi:Hpt domain-containing protein [uncultured Zhongshania sp.]|uniref:hybrid sensor histidine kinase/response regulator n=1 Tax=uncultured Zhongshania sp. TaxID=1642288 RepID=UPI0025E597EC|nr:Hpt domain-containing protein [uncultured Zhongshania sp.]
MTDRRDYIALDWVAGEISDALAQCVPLIDDYIQNGHSASLDRASMLMHQVQGSLRMIEFSGAALLVDEMERSVAAVSGGLCTETRQRGVLEAVQTSADELPAYLRRVKDSKSALPASLIMIFNELRAANDQPLLSSLLLFNPQLDLNPGPSDDDSNLSAQTFNELAGKLLKMYQIALQAYARGDGDKQNLVYLGKVSGRAAKLCSGHAQQVLWLSALALIEGLLNESIANHVAVRHVLSRLGLELKVLVSDGYAAAQRAVSLPLLKDILFYIASSPASSRYIESEREKHGLTGVFDGSSESAANSERFIERARQAVVAELMQAASAVTDNELLYSRCKGVADTLAVLGWVESLYPLKAIIEQVERGLAGQQMQAVATSLQRLAERLAANSDSALLATEQESEAASEASFDKVISQSRSVLFDAQEAIIAYVSEQWQSEHLQQVPDQLRDLAGQLSSVGFAAPALILENCAEYLASNIIAQQLVPDWQSLDALADALTSVDYYLERSSNGRQYDDDALLAGAEACVARLGYPVSGGVSDKNILHWPGAGGDERESGDAAGKRIDLDPDIADVFLEEAQEVLTLLKDTLPIWHERLDSDDYLAVVRRAFHTLKGSGRMVGATQMGELAWSVEAMLNKVVDSHFVMDDARLQLVENVTALLPDLIAALAEGRELPASSVDGLMTFADALAQEQIPQSNSSSATDEDGLTGIFMGEADTHLRVLEAYVEGVDSYPAQLTDEVQRALHTLKGSSKMAEVWPVANIITPLEGLVKELRSMRVAAGESLVALISDVVRQVRLMVTQLADTPVSSLHTPKTLLSSINALSVQLIHEAEFAADRSEHGEVSAGALDAFLANHSESVQGLLDILDEQENIAAATLVDYAQTMGVFAQRAEDINCEPVAELGQALQVLLSHAEDPIPAQFVSLVNEALEQLMDYLNQLAAEQTVAENSDLIDRIRNVDLSGSAFATDSPAVIDDSDIVEIELAEPVSDESADDVVVASTPEPEDDEIDLEILEIFLEEAADLLESLDESIHHWSGARDEVIHLDNIQRYLHTLKGGARLSGLPAVGDLSHNFETAISIAIAQRNTGSDEFFNQVQQYQDQLVNCIAAIDDPTAVAPIDDFAESIPESPATPEHIESVSTEVVIAREEQAPLPVFTPKGGNVSSLASSMARATPQEMIKVPSPLLERLINLAGETSIARGRVEEQVNEIHFSLEEMEMTVERLQGQVRRMDIETEAQIIFRQEQVESEGADGFDPLEFDRYSQLQQLSRSLLESASDLVDLRATLLEKSRDMETLLVQQSRVNTELQEGLMRSQLVNFSRMVPRLRRGIRQIGTELDKQVEFNVYNADGEMDRRVLERIIPALEHMLRNAIDHGIESPEIRAAAGKPAVGEINMRFDRQGGDVVIVISDDGGGINLQAVRRRAEDLGLISDDAELSDRQLLEYIFHAGFSTAKNVTQISGRGVGMDVVRSEIKQLGGAIDISTEVGRGSRFEIRLPFTVSVNRALMVSVGGEVFAVPLNNIEGIVRVSPYELDVYYQEGGPDFEYANQQYNLRYMGNLLDASRVPHLEGQIESRPVLLIRNAEPPTAIQVDSLLGSREVVVKTLGPQFAAVPGLSGATVLGDGSVVVILDMLASIRADVARRLAGNQRQPQPTISRKNTRLVMVVDDSVTVRKVTSRLLVRQHMEVALARDGLDAVNQLQGSERLPDVILLDIEMPRMDGFEVASRIRGNPRMKDIPIIMISSRTGQKHRQRAHTLGVHNFLGKPYQEIQLLKAIDEVTSNLVDA